MQYRKKPVVVDAFQYNGNLRNPDGEYHIPIWVAAAFMAGIIHYGYDIKDADEAELKLYIDTLEGAHHVSVGDYVIRGVDGELYPCKQDIFEKTYEKVEYTLQNILSDEWVYVDSRNCPILGGEATFSFGEAIKYLKRGFKVARKGWNGKKQYIQLATGISYKTADNEIVNCEHDAIGNKAIAFVGTSGVQMGWVASQADMLAEDWVFAESK